MRILIGALAVALLAGCSNPSMQDMRLAGPAQSFSSLKSKDDVSQCILSAWQESSLGRNGMPIAVQPSKDGGVTVVAGAREYFADITPSSSGLKVAYYQLGDSWVSKILRPEVRSCL